MPNSYETNYEIGQNNIRKWGMDIHNPVFWVSAALVLIFVIGSLLAPESAKTIFDGSKRWVIHHFDLAFLISFNLILLFCLGLAASPYGKIRIGGASARPHFSRLSWFSMLFAAGMGIGLMFWGVAEPLGYYTNWLGAPFNTPSHSETARELALGASLFHWGLHPWAMYAVVGLAFSFFTFNKNFPLSIRSGFFPLIGDRCWGWIGHVIDIIAVLATIFGLATSLGFGAQQAGGGLNYLFGIENGLQTQILIIIGITSIAIISVVRGLDGGVKILSNFNIILAALLLILVIFLGPTFEILNSIGLTLTSYAKNIIPLSNWAERTDQKFLHNWTVFYWAWWLSWSPFVGIFIARISKGRTVREFLLAVMIIPTLVTAVWMGTFGGAALHQVKNSISPLANGVSKIELSLFQMLENLPLASFTSGLGIFLVLCFFVTSSDSGSLVIDSITAGGKLSAPIPQRIFWASLEGLIAIALLIGGGDNALGALQAAAITFGLPFMFVLLILCISLWMGLYHEKKFASTEC